MWRYVANRFLTLFGNILLGTKVSEFHTGYRAFSRELLEALPLAANSDDFVFDNQVLAEAVWLGFQIGEVSCPTSYAPDASSITFLRSVRYGFGCLGTAAQFRLAKWGLLRSIDSRSTSICLQHLAPARELSEEQQQERHARQCTPSRTRRDSAARIASDMKTGNRTAVKRPTPSKPFGSDSAIEMSAHAANPMPRVRTDISANTIDTGKQHQIHHAQQRARRRKFLEQSLTPLHAKDRRFEKVVQVAHVARDSRRAIPSQLPRMQKLERIVISPVEIPANDERADRRGSRCK